MDVVEVDLNEEPTESYWNYQNDIQNVYSRIEDRIRRLEAVTMRARQRQERRLSLEVVNEEPLNLNGEIGQAEINLSLSVGLNVVAEGRLDSLKRSDDNLLALALKTNGGGEAQVKKNSGEAFFDCNICLGKARDPILTCCGHLYCWSCFYLLPDVGPDTKECPACKGDVNNSGIIPIYGSSDKAFKTAADKSGVKIPPRPRANRIESLRQQRITRGSHSVRIEEVLRTLQSLTNLSSNITSALSSAEIMDEDLEGMSYLYHPVGRRYRGVVDDDSNSDVLVDVPSETVVPNANADSGTGLPTSSTPIIATEITSASNGGSRRRIPSQEHFTELTAPRSRRGRLRRMAEQSQREQLLSSLMSRTEQQARLVQHLSGILQSEENLSDAQMVIDDPELLPVRVFAAHSSNSSGIQDTVSANPESNGTTFPSSARRREYILDTSEASGSATPEPRRRRLG